MSAPAIARSTRYINPGTTKLLWLTSVADKTAITRSEIDAGLDVSGEIADVNGWQISGDKADTPDLAVEFVSNVPGRTSAADSSITFWADRAGVDVRDHMSRGTNGYVVWMDGGDVPGYLCDIFPVRVLSQGLTRSVAGDAAATLPVQYAITSQPAQNVVIPS